MTTEQNTSNSSNGTKPDVEDIQAEIEKTRQELGETVDALTAKMDVKSRTKARLDDTRQRATVKLQDAKVKTSQLTAQAKESATDDAGKPKPAVLGGAAGAVAALVGAVVLVVVRRRRR